MAFSPVLLRSISIQMHPGGFCQYRYRLFEQHGWAGAFLLFTLDIRVSVISSLNRSAIAGCSSRCELGSHLRCCTNWAQPLAEEGANSPPLLFLLLPLFSLEVS